MSNAVDDYNCFKNQSSHSYVCNQSYSILHFCWLDHVSDFLVKQRNPFSELKLNWRFPVTINDSTNLLFLFHLFLDARYKKLLCTVDLTKDFFFSYSYQVMRSLQKNICDNETGDVLYETMFVWNEFLTRGIRNHLHNTIWTVALVYGFFKQVSNWCFLDSLH